MAAELVLAVEASADLAEAYGWYERQREGLGEDRLLRVNASIEDILRHPEMAAIVQGPYRRALVQRLPYAVFYEFADGRVIVHAVLHTATDPAKWRRRLP